MSKTELSREKELFFAGFEEGFEQGIIGTLQILSNANVPKSEAVQMLAGAYDFSTDKAREYINEYYKPSL